MVEGPRDDEPRPALGSLSRLDAGAGAARVRESVRSACRRRRSPSADFYTWNNIGPRIGLTYDLAGDGKTVIKASYGLFWHNPGPGVSADANPNQNNKSVTYTWTDRNGDRRLSAR